MKSFSEDAPHKCWHHYLSCQSTERHNLNSLLSEIIANAIHFKFFVLFSSNVQYCLYTTIKKRKTAKQVRKNKNESPLYLTLLEAHNSALRSADKSWPRGHFLSRRSQSSWLLLGSSFRESGYFCFFETFFFSFIMLLFLILSFFFFLDFGKGRRMEGWTGWSSGQ